MASQFAQSNGFSVRAHQGDAKTLLAFDAADRPAAANLAGFTIQCKPDGKPAYYLLNMLRYEHPAAHAQDASEPPNSSINAPIHKFRWLHVPGSFHQGASPFLGPYTYVVTPRFFDGNGSMLPLDPARSVSVTIDVVPFRKNGLALGFTRGFVQSQAFVHHFGLKARIQPKSADLLFDTSAVSGTNDAGVQYTFAEEYDWLGFTARDRIFDVLNQVTGDASLHLDMFAYDLNEPDILAVLLKLAKEGRMRLMLDDAPLHHDAAKPTREDQFEQRFTQSATGEAAIRRGHYGRFAHDKILIVSQMGAAGNAPRRVLTGSTNFSVTGLYVNSNHVLVFDDPAVAAKYAEVFDAAWNGGAQGKAFATNPLTSQPFDFAGNGLPPTSITYSPHDAATAATILGGMAARVTSEGQTMGGSVLFAVMELGTGTGPVFPALNDIHADESIFSYGITDTTSGICLYSRGHKTGVLVTGKPAATKLPPPFSQVPGVGLGHQIHHKFVVCGFNGADPVVFCGSSNLALQGEQVNGDNLLAIRDGDVATAFAIEAVALVDHFEFLDRSAPAKPAAAPLTTPSLTSLAESAGWFLSTDDGWVNPFFDTADLHCMDRQLFG